jgi:S-adenosylmethionine hydrolase
MEAEALAKKIITLTTDFGLRDPYVAEMKAVILSLCPDAVIVDVTHGVAKFDVRSGVYFLASAAPYFPKGTVHVAVVDPGVGTARRGLVVETKRGFFVGPDNGVLVLAAEKQGVVGVREITNPKLMLPHVSSTFHGRDVFAPAAAHLANGVPPADFGAEIHDVVKPSFAKVKASKDKLEGEVLHVDGFGNIVTNIGEETLANVKPSSSFNVEIGGCNVKARLARTYGEAKPKEAIILVGSQCYVEIAMNQRSAAQELKAKPGDKVVINRGN